MSYNFQKWYYFWLFVLFLACAKDDYSDFQTLNPNVAGEMAIADVTKLFQCVEWGRCFFYEISIYTVA